MRPLMVACDAVVNPNVAANTQKATRIATSKSPGRDICGKRDGGAPIFFAAPPPGNSGPIGSLFHGDLLDHGLLAALILKDIVKARRRIAILKESKGTRNTDVVDRLARGRGLDRLTEVLDRELRRTVLRYRSDLVADCSWIGRVRLHCREEAQDAGVEGVRRQRSV